MTQQYYRAKEMKFRYSTENTTVHYKRQSTYNGMSQQRTIIIRKWSNTYQPNTGRRLEDSTPNYNSTLIFQRKRKKCLKHRTREGM